MSNDFIKNVGSFIHHCGALEFLTNNTIKALASDVLLSSEAIQSSFYKRIILMRRLLHERSQLKSAEIDALCDDLEEIRKNRNKVAHNPIVFKDPKDTTSGSILVVRHKPEGTVSSVEISQEELSQFVEKSKQAMLKFVKLFPQATET